MEDELSFAFPSDYRSFILTFGVLFLDGHIIRGIYEEDEQELESFGVSILETKRERKKIGKFTGYPADFIVLEANSGGGYVLLIFREGKYTLENWEKDGDWYLLKEWNSFTDYLNEIVENAEKSVL
ncbi:SMI1/KNR4 family protein [Telmatocola sphagniphila]|uniref:SMI1/KNR4 family protein n=1 Tax=Telmatocola sphagniphila TaxID=1123043 RepID=A0A8E6B591_9BACT|nr:SMI1/KNR4 family protein [Telmatocola sphagniphila]